MSTTHPIHELQNSRDQVSALITNRLQPLVSEEVQKQLKIELNQLLLNEVATLRVEFEAKLLLIRTEMQQQVKNIPHHSAPDTAALGYDQRITECETRLVRLASELVAPMTKMAKWFNQYATPLQQLVSG